MFIGHFHDWPFKNLLRINVENILSQREKDEILSSLSYWTYSDTIFRSLRPTRPFNVIFWLKSSWLHTWRAYLRKAACRGKQTKFGANVPICVYHFRPHTWPWYFNVIWGQWEACEMYGIVLSETACRRANFGRPSLQGSNMYPLRRKVREFDLSISSRVKACVILM